MNVSTWSYYGEGGSTPNGVDTWSPLELPRYKELSDNVSMPQLSHAVQVKEGSPGIAEMSVLYVSLV